MSDINLQQLELLIKFKEEILKKNLLTDFSLYDNSYLLRFMRARKFDLEKTFLMFQDYIKWRKEKNVDLIMVSNKTVIFINDFTILLLKSRSPPVNIKIKELYPVGYHKTDKYGRPIFLNFLCDMQIDKIIETIKDDEVENYMIKVLETFNFHRLPMCSKAKGSYIEQGLTILNIKDIGVTFTSKAMKYIKMISSLTQNYFPETLGKMYVINSSSVFSFLWTLVKPFIDEKTTKKIHVYKSDYLEFLLEDVDSENLPKFLGGDCECHGGCMHSDKGPWNP